MNFSETIDIWAQKKRLIEGTSENVNFGYSQNGKETPSRFGIEFAYVKIYRAQKQGFLRDQPLNFRNHFGVRIWCAVKMLEKITVILKVRKMQRQERGSIETFG